jgi:hypothetical protein
VLAFDPADVAVLAAPCVAELAADGIGTPLAPRFSAGPAFDADCPATADDGTPCKEPASWPRP